MKMLAAMFYAPLDVRLEHRPVPQPDVGEVLLKVVAATTCGTDVKTYLRGHPLLIRKIPSGFGHEVAGFVAAIGLGVTKCAEGDAIVIANSAPCQQCFYCKRGNFSICEDLLLLNGAYAEYVLVPERIVRLNLYHLEPGSSFVAAALTEPLACALHGVDACEISYGDTVVILVLLWWFQFSRLVEPTDRNSFLAVQEAILDKTEARRGADIVIEAVGVPETWELAATLVRPGGLVNFFGGCPSGSRVSFETRRIHYSELTFKGVFHHTPAYFAQALELIQGRYIDIEALITARLPLTSTVDALELLVKKQGVKYALIPPDFQQDLLLSEVLL